MKAGRARGWANGLDSIEPFFTDVIGDSQPLMPHFRIIFMSRYDNLAKRRAGTLPHSRDNLAR